jgi:hypothetical protein
MSALLLAVAVAPVPLEIGHLLTQGKRLNGRWSLEGIVLYRRPKRTKKVARWAVKGSELPLRWDEALRRFSSSPPSATKETF